MKEWLDTCARSEDPIFFSVIDKATGLPAGVCSFMAIDERMRRVEIGHVWYGPSRQGSGINADVGLMLMTDAFERLGYRRVEWRCHALNERSRRAALKLGFTFEGIARQQMVAKGRNRDTAWFSLLDREWPAAKASIQARLSPTSRPPVSATF